MAQYLLAVHSVEGQDNYATEEEMMQAFADVDAFNQELVERGSWVFGGGLHPVETATVVRQTDGEILITDGPFAETKEHIGGFWVVEAPDLDAALAIASKATVACRQPVEVRPFQEEPSE